MLDPNRATLRPKLIWFNLALTVAVMVLLVLDLFPLAFVFMVGAAIALVVNFPKLRSQADEIVAHAPSIVGVVSMVLAAGVLVGVLNGTGMVTAMADWITQVIPSSMGPFLAVITGVLSIPFTFFMSNDAFYFGILPVLAESAANYGIAPVEMARASITGQPVHLQSPLVPRSCCSSRWPGSTSATTTRRCCGARRSSRSSCWRWACSWARCRCWADTERRRTPDAMASGVLLVSGSETYARAPRGRRIIQTAAPATSRNVASSTPPSGPCAPVAAS